MFNWLILPAFILLLLIIDEDVLGFFLMMVWVGAMVALPIVGILTLPSNPQLGIALCLVGYLLYRRFQNL